ncbi:MAG: hypothetical protein JWL81_3477, partial [Verrucomicrobiales bacterium]|nr:hypothetical protein [Verrucomicrobiales bacterium]
TPHTGWGALERQPGQWDWQELDAQMAYLDSVKMGYGGILIGSPEWNTADPPGHLPVNHLKGWSHYVTEVVKHCQGRIRRWEIWNEPPNFTGKNQTPADYAEIVVAAYDAAKDVDSGCLIGLAAKSAHLNYLEQVIQAGAKDHFDYITLHPYEILSTVADNVGTEPMFMNIVPSVRKMLAAQNPAKANVPVVFTELGHDLGKGPEVQAQALVKAYTMGAAQGVACIQWFEGRDGDSGPMGLLDNKGQPRPAFTAMREMIRHLGQQPVYLGWIPLGGIHRGFVFEGQAGPVLVAWAQNAGSCEFKPGASVQSVDPLTGKSSNGPAFTLTGAPLLFTNLPRPLITDAKANRNRPMQWWGADYSSATSVSLTTGENQKLDGLRSLSGDALAKSVVAYGGSARAGGVPGGNVFVVDPAFLSYTREPLEITVVCRRNEANDNAGFKLIYESTTGIKTAGHWFTIPDNKTWHTATFRLEDPQFVNYWGYNLSLESDGNTYNRYYLKSVEVRKVKDRR